MFQGEHVWKSSGLDEQVLFREGLCSYSGSRPLS